MKQPTQTPSLDADTLRLQRIALLVLAKDRLDRNGDRTIFEDVAQAVATMQDLELELLQAQRERDVQKERADHAVEQYLKDKLPEDCKNWEAVWSQRIEMAKEITQLRNAVDELVKELNDELLGEYGYKKESAALTLANNLPHKKKSPSPSASDGSTNR